MSKEIKHKEIDVLNKNNKINEDNKTNKNVKVQNLKKIKLDENYEDNIGANTIKSSYNSVLTTMQTGTKIKKIIYIPFAIKKMNREKIKKLLKLKIKKMPKNLTIKGLHKTKDTMENNFKNQIMNDINKEQVDDIGTSVIINGYSGIKEAGKIVKKSLYTEKLIKKKIKVKLKTSRQGKQIKTGKKQEIKTTANKAKKTADKITKNAKNAEKIIEKISKKISKLIFNNPITLFIAGVSIVVIVLFQLVVNLFSGIHAGLTIDFPDNIDIWKKQMEKIDNDTHSRIHSGNSLTFKNSHIDTTWKQVLAVYYVEYQDMTLKFDSGAAGMATYEVNELNPEMWEQVYNLLIEQLGKPYEWSAVGPDTFDCSGLVMWLWGQFGINLPHYTGEQCKYGEPVDMENLQPGDSIYFIGTGSYEEPGHVGIYIGNGNFIHAPHTGDVVKVSSLTDREDYAYARRYIKPSENTSSSESGSSSNSNTESQNNNDNDQYENLYNSVGQEYGDLFIKVGKEYNFDPYLLAAIAMQESTLNPNAVSDQGCVGLFQLKPSTFTGLGFNIEDIRDPYTNACAGAMYLNQMLEKTNGDLTAALQCYNYGPGNYDDVGGDVNRMPQETQNYTKYIESHYEDITNGKQLPGIVSPGTTGYSSKLKRIYDLFIEVTSYRTKHTRTHTNSDGSKSSSTYYTTTYVLTKHTLKEVEDKLNMNDEDRDLVDGILEYDNFDDFGEDYDFKFKY